MAQVGCSSPDSLDAAVALPPAVTGDEAKMNQERKDRPIEESDLLDIFVFNEKELSVVTRVQAGGTITYPNLGQVPVAGKTPTQVEELLKEKLRDGYLKNPQVTVNVKQYSSRIISVFGAVNRAGLVQLPEEIKMDIIQGIAQAGGFSQTANRNKIIFTRYGKSTTYAYKRLLKVPKDSPEKVWLEPGDVIEVKETIF